MVFLLNNRYYAKVGIQDRKLINHSGYKCEKVAFLVLLFYWFPSFYRLQQSCGKVMFLQLSVILFTGGYLPHTPPWADIPLVDTPLDRHPPVQCMLGYTPPCPVHVGIHNPLGRHPQWRHPSCPVHAWIHTHMHAWIHLPAQCMLGYGQQAGGTHPTGMHSCLHLFSELSWQPPKMVLM